jgi:diguanylate cyclase (GGDEF)-like protein
LHFKRAIVDRKTELYNHSFFMKRLEEELARLRRYKSQSALLMLDIDHFKNFNDSYGHLTGDQVLKDVALVIRECIRLEDLAARFGGEEFAVLLIQCDPDKGFLISERIREAIAGRKVVYGERELAVTVSIGVAHTATETLVQYIYNTGFQTQQLGLASAGAWVLFVIILGITAIQFLGQKRWVHYE